MDLQTLQRTVRLTCCILGPIYFNELIIKQSLGVSLRHSLSPEEVHVWNYRRTNVNSHTHLKIVCSFRNGRKFHKLKWDLWTLVINKGNAKYV